MSNVISIPLQMARLEQGQFIHHFTEKKRYEVIKVDPVSIKLKNIKDHSISCIPFSQIDPYEWCMIIDNTDQ
jgi:hypothetical protein